MRSVTLSKALKIGTFTKSFQTEDGFKLVVAMNSLGIHSIPQRVDEDGFDVRIYDPQKHYVGRAPLSILNHFVRTKQSGVLLMSNGNRIQVQFN